MKKIKIEIAQAGKGKDVNQDYAVSTDNICGVLIGAISERFDTIVEFSAFHDFISF